MCNLFRNSICEPLGVNCKYEGNEKKCSFYDHYTRVKNRIKNYHLSNKVREYMIKHGFLQKWKEYFQKGGGNKQMTARPFEDAIGDVIKEELSSFGATVSSRKKVEIGGEGGKIIADCLIERDNRPNSIISVKTWIGFDTLRESFAAAYFLKRYHGELHTKFFVVSFFGTTDWLSERSLALVSSYIDGVYSICPSKNENSFDELMRKLKDIYAD